jgi:hypothetical protein
MRTSARTAESVKVEVEVEVVELTAAGRLARRLAVLAGR